MATLTIYVPDESAEPLATVNGLEADSVELRDLVVWNIRQRADKLVGWAESSDRAPAHVRCLSDELRTLIGVYETLVVEEEEVS